MEIEILKKAANDDSILRRHLRFEETMEIFLKLQMVLTNLLSTSFAGG